MCGLVGLFDSTAASVIDSTMLRRMTTAIAHRGPDGEGFFIGPGVALGHRRLAIIDLSGGIQPMHSADGTMTVVFNGEIYNFQALMAELSARGCAFTTRSDTEVILHAWRLWGTDCVTRFSGQFAFALWDSRRQTLTLVRDRLGKKPLYYAAPGGQRLAFASEIKALAHCSWIDRTLAPDAVADYFGYGYVPDPKTIYRDILKLPPGHMLSWRRGGQPVLSCYWQPDLEPRREDDFAQVAEELSERFATAVRDRLIADVPLGAFLSGGVDSSGVVAHMASSLSDPVKTCTVGFGEASYDERAYARKIATRYGTDHVERVVAPETLLGSDLLDRIAAIYDEPFADNSALPTYRVCAIARERVTVALSGDGGDEGFGGYRRYLWHIREHQVRSAVPMTIRAPLFRTLAALYPRLAGAPRMFRAKTTLQQLAADVADAYFSNVATMPDEQWCDTISVDFRRQLQGYRASSVLASAMAAAPTDEPLLQAQYADMKTWLAGRMLVKVDRASMAHGLEVRSPLLDHDLFTWALALPTAFKVGAGDYKRLLKRALEPLVPKELLYRPKQGFAVPLAAWLRGPLRPIVMTAIASPRLRETGIFEPRKLQRLLSDHLERRRDNTAPLWSILMFERFLVNNARMGRPHAEDAKLRQLPAA